MAAARAARTRPRSRPTYDTLRGPTSPDLPDLVRDDAWAAEMETAIETHSKAELLDLMPAAEWRGVECMSRTCVVRYRTRSQPPEVMAVVQVFVFGPGTSRSHDEHVADDGHTEYTVRLHLRDEDTRARLTGAEYLAEQRPRSPERQALRDQVRDHFHHHPDDRH